MADMETPEGSVGIQASHGISLAGASLELYVQSSRQTEDYEEQNQKPCRQSYAPNRLTSFGSFTVSESYGMRGQTSQSRRSETDGMQQSNGA